jgi:hypothetical protein
LGLGDEWLCGTAYPERNTAADAVEFLQASAGELIVPARPFGYPPSWAEESHSNDGHRMCWSLLNELAGTTRG